MSTGKSCTDFYYFFQNTQKTAKLHGIVGCVKNTPRGTVQGSCQGIDTKIKIMLVLLNVIYRTRNMD